MSIAELIWFATGKFSLIWWGKNKVAVSDPKWVFSMDQRRRSTVIEEAIKKNDHGIVYWDEFRQYARK